MQIWKLLLKVYNHIKNKIEDIYYWCYGIIYDVKRTIAYARFGWNTCDFDGVYLYEMMSFKLKRLRVELENDAYHIFSKKDMKRLNQMIGICDRLFEEKYERKYLDMHDKKWGEIKTIRTPLKNSTICTTYRSKVKTKEDEKKETQEFLQCYDNASKDMNFDMDRLNVLLKKYLLRLWS